MHVHHYEFICEGRGLLPKRNTPKLLFVPGVVERCKCGAGRLVPHSELKGFRPVAIEQSEETTNGPI